MLATGHTESKSKMELDKAVTGQARSLEDLERDVIELERHMHTSEELLAMARSAVKIIYKWVQGKPVDSEEVLYHLCSLSQLTYGLHGYRFPPTLGKLEEEHVSNRAAENRNKEKGRQGQGRLN